MGNLIMVDFSALPIVRTVLRKVQRMMQPPIHRIDTRVDYEVLGTDYGGWPVIEGSLTPSSRVYSFGVGHDISFDLAVMARYNCMVDAFDPTPRCIEWLAQQELPGGLRFHPVGLSDQTQTLRFSAPPEEAFVSYTVADRADASEVVELPVRALDEIMKDLGDTEIDLLKMDIEGSEYAVIADMLEKRIRPMQICVEFHHRKFGYLESQTREAIAGLRAAGYRVFYVSPGGREYGFHLQDRSP